MDQTSGAVRTLRHRPDGLEALDQNRKAIIAGDLFPMNEDLGVAAEEPPKSAEAEQQNLLNFLFEHNLTIQG